MSSNEWQMVRLGNIAQIIDSLHKTPSYSDDGFPMVRVTDIKGGFLSLEKTFKVTEDVYKEFSRKYKPRRGDIVFSRVGTYGVASYINSDEPFCLGQNTVFIVPKIDNRFLYYSLTAPVTKNQIEQLAVGSTQKTISLKSIKDIEIRLPDWSTQHRIADILSALDDKIELNRQTNATLEAMAQAIFKEWFVDFNYPGATGELVDSELGLIPPGWRVGKLGEVCEFAYGKALRADNRVQGEYPVVGSSGIVDTHNEYLVEGPGIVIGRKGTIGEVIWLHENFFPIDTTFYIKDLLDVNGLYFHYFLLQQQDFKKIGSDSAVPGLNRNQAYDSFVIIPEVDAVQQFTDLVQVIFAKIFNNSQQTTTLTQIRDSLLPKLMCGEIAV